MSEGGNPSPLAGEGVSRRLTDEGSHKPRTTVAQARALRKAAPSTERLLWKLLRDRRLAELKFRRQVPIGPYIVDFVCLRHRLVVEADGPFHDAEQDSGRDAWLATQGFRVLRFPNRMIDNRGSAVIAAIIEATEAPPARGDV